MHHKLGRDTRQQQCTGVPTSENLHLYNVALDNPPSCHCRVTPGQPQLSRIFHKLSWVEQTPVQVLSLFSISHLSCFQHSEKKKKVAACWLNLNLLGNNAAREALYFANEEHPTLAVISITHNKWHMVMADINLNTLHDIYMYITNTYIEY